MVSVAAISTAAAISAYFFGQAFSGNSLNESDPIKGQPLPLPYYIWVFGCGLVFWLLVLLWPKLHYSGDKDPRQKDIREVAKLSTAITIINLCSCLALPVRKLPLLVRFLVLFQLSSNLALLLIWASLSIHKYIMVLDAATFKCTEYLRRRKEGPPFFFKSLPLKREVGRRKKGPPRLQAEGKSHFERTGKVGASKGKTKRTANLYTDREDDFLTDDSIDQAAADFIKNFKEQLKLERAASVSPFSFNCMTKLNSDVEGAGERSAARGETRLTPNLYADRGDGYGGEAGASESDHGKDGEGDASGGNHGSEAGGSEESGVGSGGGGGGGDRGEGQGDPELGLRETNKEATLKISKISEMSIMLTAQTTAAVIGFHLTTPSSSTKVLLVVVLVDQLVAYLCGLTSMLLECQNPGAARVFTHIGFACTTLGYILMVAMFVDWYLVLIIILLFGVVWIIFFQGVWYPLFINACIGALSF